MMAVLLLFLNKITTPRYLSDIELKINKLELMKQPVVINNNDKHWLLLSSNPRQQTLLEGFMTQLRDSIQKNTQIADLSQLNLSSIGLPYNTEDNIGIVNPKGELIGYFKAPFDEHKMILTYSSVFTHR